MGCCFTVPEYTVGVVERFGKFERLAPAGLNFLMPMAEQVAGQVTLRLRQLTVETAATTKDSVSVTVTVAVQYRVRQSYTCLHGPSAARSHAAAVPEHPVHASMETSALLPGVLGESEDLSLRKRPSLSLTANTEALICRDGVALDDEDIIARAYYKVQNPEEQMRAVVATHIRTHLADLTLDEAFSLQTRIASQVAHPIQVMVGEYGFSVVKVNVLNLQPEADVKQSCNGIILAQAQREVQRQEAEAAKYAQIKASEAEAEASRIAGNGIAQQRLALCEGLYAGLNGRHTEMLLPLLLLRFTDALRDCAQGKGTADSGGNGLVVSYDVAGFLALRAAVAELVSVSLRSDSSWDASM